MKLILTILFTTIMLFGVLALMRFMLEHLVGILFACFGFFVLLTCFGLTG